MQAERDTFALKTVWSALESSDALAEYATCRKRLAKHSSYETVLAAREAFAAWYDGFHQRLSNDTKGWWGDYSMKCMLDVPCNLGLPSLGAPVQLFPDVVLARWPVRCPAYVAGLRKLLKPQYKTKKLSADLKYKLLMRVHAKLSARLGAQHHSVSTTLAQLCWQERQKKM